MGISLLPADRWNQRGYYEDRQFLGLHRIMAFPIGDAKRIRLNLPAEHPDPAPPVLARYERAIRNREDQRIDWGIKDPWLTFCFDVFRQICRDEIRAVVPRRDPAESVASLRMMFNLAPSAAATVMHYFEQQRNAVLARFEGPVLEVEYADALAAPGNTVAALADFVGHKPNAAALRQIDPNLYHQRFHDEPAENGRWDGDEAAFNYR
jgi:hypothetical protein